jgi:hypothetical protein
VTTHSQHYSNTLALSQLTPVFLSYTDKLGDLYSPLRIPWNVVESLVMENAVRYCLAVVRLFPNLRASIIVRLALALLPHIVARFIQERMRVLNTGYAAAVTPWVGSECQKVRLEFLRLAELQREPNLGSSNSPESSGASPLSQSTK